MSGVQFRYVVGQGELSWWCQGVDVGQASVR